LNETNFTYTFYVNKTYALGINNESGMEVDDEEPKSNKIIINKNQNTEAFDLCLYDSDPEFKFNLVFLRYKKLFLVEKKAIKKTLRKKDFEEIKKYI
jgi:hypothetical protein